MCLLSAKKMSHNLYFKSNCKRRVIILWRTRGHVVRTCSTWTVKTNHFWRWWKDQAMKVTSRGFKTNLVVCWVTWCRWKNAVVQQLLWTRLLQDRGAVVHLQNGTPRWTFANISSSVPVRAITWATETLWTTRYISEFACVSLWNI